MAADRPPLQDRDGAGLVLDKIRRRFPPAAPLGGRAHLLLVRPKPASCQGLREPCRNPGHLRYPRLNPTGPQAARQGVGRDGGGLQRWTAVLRRRPGQRRSCAEIGPPSQSAGPSGSGVSLSGMDLKVGRSAKRRTRRRFRPERSIRVGRTWAAGKGRANVGRDSEADHSGGIGSLADRRTPPRA